LAATTVTTIDSTIAPLTDIRFPSIYICNINQVYITKKIKKIILSVDRYTHCNSKQASNSFVQYVIGPETLTYFDLLF
jgi:hypothetical protein